MTSSRWFPSLKSIKDVRYHRDFENYRDLIFVMVQRDIQARYKNKLLGYLWSVASPLTSALVYFFAFKIVMKVHIDDYSLVLISGLFPWQWFANSIGSAPNMFIGSAGLIKKVNFPRSIIPLCMILNHMIHFAISIPVIVLFLFIYGKAPTLSWLYGVPILLCLQFLLVYGVSLVLASLNLFFRDLERLVGILMSFLFFLTPILYLPEMIPPGVRRFIAFNPASPLIISWKELFLEGKLEPTYLMVSLLYALFFFVVGYSIYKKLSWRFAEIL